MRLPRLARSGRVLGLLAAAIAAEPGLASAGDLFGHHKTAVVPVTAVPVASVPVTYQYAAPVYYAPATSAYVYGAPGLSYGYTLTPIGYSIPPGYGLGGGSSGAPGAPLPSDPVGLASSFPAVTRAVGNPTYVVVLKSILTQIVATNKASFAPGSASLAQYKQLLRSIAGDFVAGIPGNTSAILSDPAVAAEIAAMVDRVIADVLAGIINPSPTPNPAPPTPTPPPTTGPGATMTIKVEIPAINLFLKTDPTAAPTAPIPPPGR